MSRVNDVVISCYGLRKRNCQKVEVRVIIRQQSGSSHFRLSRCPVRPPMPLTSHTPAVALSKEDKPATISSRSPPPYSPVRSVASNLPVRDSPPPTKSGSRPTSPAQSRDAAKSTPQPEAKSEVSATSPRHLEAGIDLSCAQKTVEEAEDEPEDDGPPIDMETFTQILELDDEEEDREFSRGMVYEYFAQVEKTFQDLDKAL